MMRVWVRICKFPYGGGAVFLRKLRFYFWPDFRKVRNFSVKWELWFVFC